MNDHDDIFSVAYLKNATRKSDLIKRLNELHKSLSKLSQDESQLPKELKTIAKQLVSERILNHSDKEIRLVASCCLVDIFRIYAPDAPFGDDDMVTVFEVIISQLRSLATNDTTSGIGMKTFYILNSLSTFKSCVLTIILAENGVKGGVELVTSLFDALITSIRQEHNEEISNHMANVLQACIEESGDLDQDVLDILLTPLLPNSKSENPAAYMLVGNVLRRVSSVIINPITSFINHILVGTGASDKGSELADHVYSLIYELHKISPSLLLRVLPNVSMQLQAEDDTIRTNAVKLLGRLFASPHADYCNEFAKNFKDFLMRFNDKSAAIRSEMVENAALIIKRKPGLTNQVEESLVRRLSDTDHDIRLITLNKLLELAQVDLKIFSANTYKEIGGRVIDKKPEIKRTAMQGLAKLYCRNVSSLLPTLDTINANQDFNDLVNPDAFERLSYVPSHIVKCWGFPDQKHLTLTLLQEYILPKVNTKSDASEKKEEDNEVDGRRACAVILLFTLLDASDRIIFGSILTSKRKFQIDLQSFLESRAKLLSTQDSSFKASNENSFKRAMFRLSSLLPSADKKVTVSLEKLHSMKDKTVFKLLSKCILADDNIYEACSNRESLKQRVDSKSVLGQNVEFLYDMAGYLLVNAEMINHVLEYVTKCEEATEDTVDVAHLVSLLAKHHPTVFSTSSSLLEEWITSLTNTTSSSKRKSKSNTLRLLDSCILTINEAGLCLGSEKNADSICKVIISRAMEYSDPGICEQLAIAALRIALVSSLSSKSAENVIIKAIKQLTSKKQMSLSNDRLACDLSTLAGLFRMPPSLSTKVNFSQLFTDSISPSIRQLRDNVIEFITMDVLESEESDVTTMEASLKIWTNVLSAEEEIAQKHGDTSDEENELLSRQMNSLIKTIFDCLDSNGSKLGVSEIDDKPQRIHVYETAACCCMNLLKLKSVAEEKITISQWQTLAWTLLHDNDETRKNIFEAFRSQMLAYPLHHRYLVYPCLLASDEVLGVVSKSVLKTAISRLRNSHEELCSRALREDSDELRLLAEQHIPETIIPFALHLLSYHPEFPETAETTGESDKKRLKALIKCINMLLDVLAETLQNQAENVSFLIKQVNLISQHYEDRQDPQNIGLQYITKVTWKLLKDRAKTGENLQPYPGDINLPFDLFQTKKATKTVGLENADVAIDKAVQASSRSKQTVNRHKSPKAKADSSVDVSAKKKESKPKGSKAKEPKQKKASTPVDLPERTSSRQTKKTSYVEAEEDEKEIEEWHNNAGKNTGSNKKTNNPIKSNRKTYESDDDEDMDDGENEAKENLNTNMDIDDDDDDDDKHKNVKKASKSTKQLNLNNFVKTTSKENVGDSSKKRKVKKMINDDDDDEEEEEFQEKRPSKAARKPIR